MHWHSKPTVSWTYHVYHWCRLCLQLLSWRSDHPQSTHLTAHSGLLWSTRRQWTELKFQGGQQPNWHNNPDGLLNIWISPPKLKKKKKPNWTQAKFPREEGKCVQRNADVEHLGWMWFRLVVQRWGQLLFFLIGKQDCEPTSTSSELHE